MRNLLIATIVLASVALIGCGAAEPEGKVDTPETGTTNDPATNQAPPTGTESTSNSGGGDSGIQIHGAGAGGVAPVTGTESMGGGGGGVQQAAKKKALETAGSAGAGSAGQLGNDEGGE